MEILWTLLTLPYAPVRGFTAVVKAIQRQAEAQLYDPANVRRGLEEADRMAAEGQISEAERDRIQQEVLNRLVTPTVTTPEETAPGQPAGAAVPVQGHRAEPERGQRPVRRRSPATRSDRGRRANRGRG